VGGVELFQLSEHTSGLYTAHFAAFQGYHYEGCFNVKTTTYEQHAAEIVKLARLFIGSYPAGIVYADRYTSKGGDYKRLAFLPYHTLKLEIEADCPADLAERIKTDAASYKEGDTHQVSSCGQTITLGSLP